MVPEAEKPAVDSTGMIMTAELISAVSMVEISGTRVSTVTPPGLLSVVAPPEMDLPTGEGLFFNVLAWSKTRTESAPVVDR